MTYVFDTGAFIVLKNYYPGAFSSLWTRIDALAANGTLTSVREVFTQKSVTCATQRHLHHRAPKLETCRLSWRLLSNELHNYNDSDYIQDWAKQHKAIFAPPSNDELLVVQQILAIPHFQTLIGNKAILKGTPVADPFVVAAGKVKESIVVTQEVPKPNAAKVPNVCLHFGVP